MKVSKHKYFVRPDEDDKSEEDESQEEGLKNRNKNRFRSPLDAREQLAALFRSKVKKKDEVDKMIDQMQEDEDDKIEELVLTEMAEDPNDLKYALDDMKVRGLKKTMSKMPPNSKKSYIAKLMKEDSLEAELGEDMDPEMRMPIRFMGNRPRHDYPMPMAPDSSMEDSYYYNTRELVRGGFPPPPQTPPVPHGGRKGNHELYEKNFKILEETLGPPPPGYRPRGPPPHMMGRREKKNMQWGGPPPRGFLQKKRGEVEEVGPCNFCKQILIIIINLDVTILMLFLHRRTIFLTGQELGQRSEPGHETTDSVVPYLANAP